MANKSLPWVELLPNKTEEIETLLTEVRATMGEIDELKKQASLLLDQAYKKSLRIEALATEANGVAGVAAAKKLSNC